jgi:RNA polymerase sigma-70 factor (ECF subfamily)
MSTHAAAYRFDSALPDLVERLARGESDAVAEAYDRHHEAVRAFATSLLGDAAAAEDLVHDVFVALPRVIRRYRRRASLRTFLIGVAVNRARHHVRAAARRRRANERLAALPRADVEDPETVAQRGQLAAALSTALDRLPLRQRIAFVLCVMEERTSVEAAEIVGVSEGTIRSRLFHAKRKLRAALETEGLR